MPRLHDLTLIHYSDTPLLSVRDATEANARRDPYFKPAGLWVSVQGPDDRASWCESESFADISAKVHTRIVLTQEANILHLQSCEDIDNFTRNYLVAPRYAADRSIDWPRVAKDFDGIVIAPYQWQRRMTHHTFWYYSWDCASGCIWKARAVECLIDARATAGMEVS